MSVDPVKSVYEVWRKRAKRENVNKGVYFVNINFFDIESLEREKKERLDIAQANKSVNDLDNSK